MLSTVTEEAIEEDVSGVRVGGESEALGGDLDGSLSDASSEGGVVAGGVNVAAVDSGSEAYEFGEVAVGLGL